MTTENTDPDRSADPAIDWDTAHNLTGGDEELLDELIELFPEESTKHLEEIRVAIEQGDASSLTRAAHTLKSSARLFGALSLADRALEMETLGQSSSIQEAQARLPDLTTETRRVNAALQHRPEPRGTQ